MTKTALGAHNIEDGYRGSKLDRPTALLSYQTKEEIAMARKSTRNAQGSGTIRKKTVTRGGKTYTYWEARYTEGVDPGSGKQVQRSITGKTQKEVSQKLKAITTSIDAGTYTPPNRLTVGE